MIVKEFYRTRADGVNLNITYSSDGFKIKKMGTEEVYDEAIDVENAPFEYEETSEIAEFSYSIKNDIEAKAKAYDILTGTGE